MKKYNFTIKGLDCANCIDHLEEALKKVPIIKNVTIDFVRQKLIFECLEENKNIALEEIIKIIEKEELGVKIINEKNDFKEKKNHKLIQIIICIFLFLIALFFNFHSYLITNILYFLSYIVVGYDVISKAFRNIMKGKIFDENFLMTIATIGAFFIGQYSEAVIVMLLYQIGEMFQDYAVDKSRRSITSLMDIRPDYANLYKDGKVEKVDPKDVKVGDIILIKPGEKIPLDGVVIEGESFLNTFALTGEATLKHVKPHDEVLSGSLNSEKVLKLKVTKEFALSTVSKILDLVENASTRKSKSENFISKFAKYYTPIVVIIAIFLAILPPLIIKNASFDDWIYRALSFLVISCPCALVISVPLSFFAGIGACSRLGVLIKGSTYLENLSKTEIVVFDKTGTLTEGTFKVQKIASFISSKDEVLKYAAYAEYYSNHPIAFSIKEAYGKKINEKYINKIQEISGKGISAHINNRNVLVGNEKLMIDNNIKYEKNQEMGTVIYVAVDKKFLGSIIVRDQIKEDSYKAVKLFRENNIKKLVMLTGDLEDTSRNVASHLHLDEYYAELLPQDKVKIVEKLNHQKSKEGKLLCIGDGINDAPVLAISDIGVAMGGIGSDAAIEAADIVVMTDESSKIADAIKISNKTMKIVKENIVFAITIKVLILLLSILKVANMWEAVFADVGVSLLAIINSLRILKYKIK